MARVSRDGFRTTRGLRHGRRLLAGAAVALIACQTPLFAQENKILSAQLPFKPPASDGHVYELRTYRTPVGRAGEWLGHFKAIMPVREKYSKNVGVFQTEMGQLNEVVHLWAYNDLNDRAAVRSKVMQDPEWQTFLGKATPILLEMKSIILNPSPHSPMK